MLDAYGLHEGVRELREDAEALEGPALRAVLRRGVRDGAVPRQVARGVLWRIPSGKGSSGKYSEACSGAVVVPEVGNVQYLLPCTSRKKCSKPHQSTQRCLLPSAGNARGQVQHRRGLRVVHLRRARGAGGGESSDGSTCSIAALLVHRRRSMQHFQYVHNP